MSAASDLVAVVGELDREIERIEDPEARAEARAGAATLIPPLGHPDAPGWYDRLPAEGRPEVGGLDAAMEALTVPTELDQVLPRRLAVLGAVSRALPDRYGPEGTQAEVVQRALSVERILVDEEPEPDRPPGIRSRAAELHAMLNDRARLPDIRAYPRLLDELVLLGMAHPALLSAPAPCATELVILTRDGATEVAVALTTQVCVTGVDFEHLAGGGSFLNPANWDSYDYWCSMTPDPANPQHPSVERFREEVALDCGTGWLQVAVWLDFTPLVRVGQRTLLRDYGMTRPGDIPPAGPAGNGAVSVDEGSLKVVKEIDHLRVSSTKRVHFRIGLDSTVIAVLACVGGYGAMAADFVVEGTGGVARSVGCAPSELPDSLATTQAPEPFDPLEGPVTDVLATFDECVAATQHWTRRVTTGTYTPEAMARDVAGSVVRSLRLFAELSGVAAVLADPPPVQDDVTSDRFHVDPAAVVAGPVTLTVVGPLRSLSKQAEIPALPSRVWCVPPQLATATDPFFVRVRPAGAPAGNYLGSVVATDGLGNTHDIDVDVQVP